jgi:hypothetical protein
MLKYFTKAFPIPLYYDLVVGCIEAYSIKKALDDLFNDLIVGCIEAYSIKKALDDLFNDLIVGCHYK